MIDGTKAQRVLADKAYASKANRTTDAFCSPSPRRGFQARLCRGAPAGFGKALSRYRLKASSRRAMLRQHQASFGKRGLHRARYFGLAKTHAHLAMAAIGRNPSAAANKIKIKPASPGNRITKPTARLTRCPDSGAKAVVKSTNNVE